MKAYKLLALVILLSSGMVNSALAQTSTWNGISSGTWSNTSNWSGGVIPATSSNLVFDGNTGSTITATDDINGASATYATITFASTAGSFILAPSGTVTQIKTQNITDSSTATETINLKIANASTRTINVVGSGNLILGGIYSGAGGITANGAGTLTLGANETYTGATSVSNGTLIVNGANSSAGSVTVSNGATLAGTGSITSAAATTNSLNGTIQGGAPGLTTTGSLTITSSGTTTFGATANLVFNLAQAGNSNQLNMNTSATNFLSGAKLTVDLVDSGTLTYTNGAYDLIAGSSAGQFSVGGVTISGTNPISGLTLNLTGPNTSAYGASYLFLDTNGDIAIEVVPEPGTWVLMLGGLGLLVIIQRARRSKNS